MNALTQDTAMNFLRRNAMKALNKIGSAALLAAACATGLQAGTVTLDWDAPTPTTNVAGYTVWRATDSTMISVSTQAALGNANITRTDIPSAATLTLNVTAPAGTYYFRATARNSSDGHSEFCDVDTDGGDETTGVVDNVPLTVVITNAAPTVSFSNVVEDRNFRINASTTITANASDSDGTIQLVRLLYNGVQVGSDVTVAPYSFPWTVPGTPVDDQTLAVVAVDNNNTHSTHTFTSIDIVGNTSPTAALAITRSGVSVPSGGSVRVGSSLVLTGTFTDDLPAITHMRFTHNGTDVNTDTTPNPYSHTLVVSSLGRSTFTATARDTDNAEATTANYYVDVVPNALPSASITQVRNTSNGNAILTSPATPRIGSVLTVDAAASDTDGTINRVLLHVDGVAVSTDSVAPFASFSYTVSDTNAHNLMVMSVDNDGGFSPASGNFTVTGQPNQAPVIAAMSAQTVLLSGGVALNPTVTDGDDAANTLSFQWNPVTLPPAAVVPQFSAPTARQTNVTFYNTGTYVLRLTARDPLNASTTGDVTVNVVSLDMNMAFHPTLDNTVIVAARSSVFSGPTGALTIDMPTPTADLVLTLNRNASDTTLYTTTVAVSAIGTTNLPAFLTGSRPVTLGATTFNPTAQAGSRVTPILGGRVMEDPSAGNGAQVTFMPGGVSQDATVLIATLGADARRTAALRRQNLRAIGDARDFTLSAGTVNAATLRLPYTATLVPQGVPATNIKMGYYNPATDTWELFDATTAAGNVQCNVTHFSIYMPVLFEPPAGLKESFAYPNPAKGINPTIRAVLGMVQSVEFTIFDISGQVVHSATMSGDSFGVGSDGTYHYDYVWRDAKASGTYNAVIHGKTDEGKVIRARARFAVVK